jgi:hypothetical protein
MGWLNELRADGLCTDTASAAGQIEVVVPYSEPALTAAVLEKVAVLTAGLDARVSLIAVHTLPYPLPFVCPALIHAQLVEQLVELASHCGIPVNPQVVLARGWTEGFRYVLKPGSTVLIGVRKQFWRSPEETLARTLARDGHKVTVVQVP